MAFGLTIRRTGRAFISMLTERCTRVSGRKIYNMERALKLGQTKVDMRASMLSGESTVLELISGTTVANILETGVKIK